MAGKAAVRLSRGVQRRALGGMEPMSIMAEVADAINAIGYEYLIPVLAVLLLAVIFIQWPRTKKRP